jgi:hypothetical protein
MTRHVYKAPFVVAAVMSLVLLLAAPAAAGSPASITGTITIGTEMFTIDTGPTDCVTPSGDMTFTENPPPGDGSGVYTLTLILKIAFQLGGAGQWYQFTFTIIGLTNATWSTNGSPPPTYNLTGTVTWEATIELLDPVTCAKTNYCVIRARTVLVAPSGHTGTLPTPATGDTTDIVSDSAVAGGIATTVVLSPCGSTFAAVFIGKRMQTNIQLTW